MHIYECGCNPKEDQFCGITCMNRLYFAECDANLCLNGNKCQNRRFQNREWHKVQLRKAGNKGFGLFANERIQKYDFIIEYVGEVIDAKEAKFRLRHQYFGSTNFYILSLRMVFARFFYYLSNNNVIKVCSMYPAKPRLVI